MTLTFFLIFGLATWRIASLFVQEDGPFFMFRRLRELAGIEHDDDGGIVLIPDTFFALALSCMWCCSIWVGAAWTVLWLLFPEFSAKLATVFALSAAAIWIDSRVKRD
jgi:hypothetical protein